MPSRIAERLKSERRRLFVGRTAEKKLFTAALTSDDPPFYVMYVYGPGGVGKTTLLHELALDRANWAPTPPTWTCATSRRPPVHLLPALPWR